MIATLTFKQPDVIDDAINDALADGHITQSDIPRIRKLAEQFVHDDEYAYLDLDTDSGTCVVRPVKKHRRRG